MCYQLLRRRIVVTPFRNVWCSLAMLVAHISFSNQFSSDIWLSLFCILWKRNKLKGPFSIFLDIFLPNLFISLLFTFWEIFFHGAYSAEWIWLPYFVNRRLGWSEATSLLIRRAFTRPLRNSGMGKFSIGFEGHPEHFTHTSIFAQSRIWNGGLPTGGYQLFVSNFILGCWFSVLMTEAVNHLVVFYLVLPVGMRYGHQTIGITYLHSYLLISCITYLSLWMWLAH